MLIEHLNWKKYFFC